MSCAHSFGEWCKECIDGVVQQYNTVRRDLASMTAERDALREELAKWKICENCGEPLAGPGICDQAISEKEKGLEQMWEETMTRAETAERELAEARAERDALLVEKAHWHDWRNSFENLAKVNTQRHAELVEARAEIARLTQACQWQPIETAERVDGRPMAAICVCTVAPTKRLGFVFWSQRLGAWWALGATEQQLMEWPTHVMPIPPLPPAPEHEGTR